MPESFTAAAAADVCSVGSFPPAASSDVPSITGTAAEVPSSTGSFDSGTGTSVRSFAEELVGGGFDSEEALPELSVLAMASSICSRRLYSLFFGEEKRGKFCGLL
jgi:hypothetical protein